jgi:uncharacterized protein
MKTIRIISDTHGTLSPKAYACLYGCDHIIHAGDVGDSSILQELKEIAPVTAVLGNCDDAFLIRGLTRRVRTETLEGVVFAVVHRSNQLKRDLLDVASYYQSKTQGICPKIIGIHGHTHIPEIKTGSDATPADLIVCPGSVSFPRNVCASFCEVVVDDGKISTCEIKDLEGKTLQKI